MLIFLILFQKLYACDFTYQNNGQTLVYSCDKNKISEKPITIKDKKVYFGEKLASTDIQQKYQKWKLDKKKLKTELSKQKDQFNCH